MIEPKDSILLMFTLSGFGGASSLWIAAKLIDPPSDDSDALASNECNAPRSIPQAYSELQRNLAFPRFFGDTRLCVDVARALAAAAPNRARSKLSNPDSCDARAFDRV